MQEDRVHYREDRGIGANSECQRQDRDCAEPGVLDQYPYCVPDVLPESLHMLRLFLISGRYVIRESIRPWGFRGAIMGPKPTSAIFLSINRKSLLRYSLRQFH